MSEHTQPQWLASVGLSWGRPPKTALAFPHSPMPAGAKIEQWLPSSGEACHALFQLTSAPDDPGKVHNGIMRLVRTLNLLEQADTPWRAVVMVAGPATPCVMKVAPYRLWCKQASLEENPNALWWDILRQRDVPVLVCLQALAAQNIPLDDVDTRVEPVQSGLSAALALGRHGFLAQML